MMEMDYEIYAQGEAELGWLNCQVKANAQLDNEKFQLDEVVLAFVEEIGQQLASAERRSCTPQGSRPNH